MRTILGTPPVYPGRNCLRCMSTGYGAYMCQILTSSPDVDASALPRKVRIREWQLSGNKAKRDWYFAALDCEMLISCCITMANHVGPKATLAPHVQQRQEVHHTYNTNGKKGKRREKRKREGKKKVHSHVPVPTISAAHFEDNSSGTQLMTSHSP